MAETARKTRTAVLISGRGSNLKALIEASGRRMAATSIDLVIANRPTAAGLTLATASGIPAEVIDHRRHDRRVGFERALNEALCAARIELVCLAGFMRILSPWFVERWRDRLLNIHPSLLPAFRGLDTHRRALAAGVRVHGCTVHLVRAELDHGPILVQGVVPVAGDDTADSLAARVLAVEHRCYPLALELVASGRARIRGDRVVIAGMTTPTGSLIVPEA